MASANKDSIRQRTFGIVFFFVFYNEKEKQTYLFIYLFTHSFIFNFGTTVIPQIVLLVVKCDKKTLRPG